MLKIVRRLSERRLEANMKKQAMRIRKYGKKNRRVRNCLEDYSKNRAEIGG